MNRSRGIVLAGIAGLAAGAAATHNVMEKRILELEQGQARTQKALDDTQKALDYTQRALSYEQALLDAFSSEAVPYVLGLRTEPAKGGFLESLKVIRENAETTMEESGLISVDFEGKRAPLPRKGLVIPPYPPGLKINNGYFDGSDLDDGASILGQGPVRREDYFPDESQGLEKRE